MVMKKGETIILVPCWWDASVESLASSISFARPDLIPPNEVRRLPIPLNPSSDSFKTGRIPEIGELMLASFPEDKDFATSISVQNSWWMGEKYDGVRFCWNPNYKYTRRGLPLELGEAVLDGMPSFIFVDGEIWFGRGLFPEAQRLVKSLDFVGWDSFRMVSFDVPSVTFQTKPFEKRYTALLASDTVNKGGEGIILRKVRSLYERGRSLLLFKLKVARGDSEGIVMKFNADKSVDLKLADGGKFTVAAGNVKVAGLQQGDVVTFSYDDYSRRAVPVNPVIYQLRLDRSWDDVLFSYHSEASDNQILNKSSRLASGFTEHPLGYWTAQNGKNMRKFLEDYARSKNLDPLLPGTWYNIPWKEIKKIKGSNFVQHYSGSYIKSLLSLFPEIGLDESKFVLAPKKYWLNVARRRQFFQRFAQAHSFDAHVAENWYSIRPSSVIAFKGGKAVLAVYASGSLRKALIHLFPDVGLDESKFVTYPKNYFQDKNAQKKFFLWFAQKRGFNPLIPENWYPITANSILPYKGARIILRYHSDSVANALLSLFPEIGLQKHRFFSSKLSWDSADRRQNFFLSFATKRNFNPLVPENWYSIEVKNLLAFSANTKTVLGYYANLRDALIQLFPNIGIDHSKFLSVSDNYWTKATHRRQFFEDYAKYNAFDALIPENWYSVTKRDIMTQSGAKYFLMPFSGSLIKTLIATFPEITFDPKKFIMLPRNFFQVDANKRKFFLRLAQKHSFDPKIPENWYNFGSFPKWANSILRPNRATLAKNVVEKFKGMESMIEHYSANVPITLISVFPNLKWDVRKFASLSGKYWQNVNNRKEFFEKFAKENQFDPLITTNWYKVNLDEILNRKDASRVMQCYSNNVVEALVSLFPKIGLKRQKFFSPPPKDRGSDARSFFKSIANHYNFDPLVAENWYHLPRKAILTFKGARGILEKDNSYANVLMKAFPDIQPPWQEIRFTRVSRNYWLDMNNRKRVFDEFAKQHNFDPNTMSNWYQRPIEKLLLVPGVNSILCHYNKNIREALAHIYGNKKDETIER